MMTQLLLRFVIGGVIVSLFALIGEMVKPKRFAGLFGAAPSVALATIPLTLMEHDHAYVATEARSMVLGAVAFLIYAWCVSRLIKREPPALLATTVLLPVWGVVAAGLYFLLLRGHA